MAMSWNPNVQYVSPNGDDSNDGYGWDRAKKTGYMAYAALVPLGGGRIYLADGCSWGGPVDGQGMWIRGDSVDLTLPGYAGWQKAIPCIIEGVGPSIELGIATPWQGPGIATLYAGSNLLGDNRRKPAVWMAYTGITPELRNLYVIPALDKNDGQYGNYTAYRYGWDYNRIGDPHDPTPGGLFYQEATQVTRTGPAGKGSTQFTVNLSETVNIDSAWRDTLGVVTLTMSLTGAGLTAAVAPPFEIGSVIYFNDTSGLFGSGSWTVESVNTTQLGLSDWTVTFHDGVTGSPVGGPDPHDQIPTPGTVRSIIAVPGDLIDVESTYSDFPSTQYRVIGTSIIIPSSGPVTSGTITVNDMWGGSDGRVTDPPTVFPAGTSTDYIRILHQQRSYYLTVRAIIRNCTSRGPTDQTPPASGTEYFRFGPMFDFGASTAFPPEMHDCYVEGYMPASTANPPSTPDADPPAGVPYTDLVHPYDEFRSSAVLVYGGNGASPGLKAYNTTGAKASFRFVGNNPNFSATDNGIVIEHVLFDVNNGQMPAAYIIDGNNASLISIVDVQCADFNVGFGPALNQINGVQPLAIVGDNTAVGPWSSAAPNIGPFGGDPGVNGTTASPWVNLKVATWSDLKISGKHPAAWRQLSPTHARFTNMIDDPSEWSVAGTPTDDPLGGSNALRFDETSLGQVIVRNGGMTDDVNSFAAGGRYVLAGWFRYSDALLGAPANSIAVGFTGFGDAIWKSTMGANWLGPVTFFGDGWQYAVWSDTVVSASASQRYYVAIGTPTSTTTPPQTGTTDVFGLQAFYVPPSVSDNDFYEFIGTLRSQPRYLRANMTGTFEGQKFVAHGGMGIDASVPNVSGTGTGQLTIGPIAAYEPRYAADGRTILGWAPLYSATINLPPLPSTGLKLWLKADAGLTPAGPPGSSVSSWADQSGNGNDAVQTGGAQPTLAANVMNGRPGLQFVTGDFMAGASNIVPDDSPVSVFAIVQFTNTGFNNGLLAMRQSGEGPNLCLGAGASFYWVNSVTGAGNQTESGITLLPGTPYEYEWTFDGTLAHTFTGAINTIALGISGAGTDSDAGQTAGYFLGGRRTDGFNLGFAGYICELIVYDHVVTGTELADVRTYLEAKYGIALGAP